MPCDHFDLTIDCEDSAKLSVSTDYMISLIRERSCLWDKTDVGYGYTLRREDAWSEVYRELYPNYDNLKEMQKAKIGQQITKKWCSVRRAYVRSIKFPKKRPYKYSKAMSFMDKVILGDRYNPSDYLEEKSLEGEPEVLLNETLIDVDASAQEPATKKSKPDYSCFLEDTAKMDILITDESTDKMISLIRERSCLWDKTDAGYSHNLRRNDAWSEVYRELYPNYDNLEAMQKARIRQQITNKWFYIRRAHISSIKGPKKRPYKYSKAMSFMDKVILDDRYNPSDYFDEQYLKGEPEVLLNETLIDVDVSAQEPATKIPKPDYSCFLEGENDTVASIPSKMINREEDEDRAFFTSIMPTVKAIPDNLKFEFRIEVMQLMIKLKNDKNKGIVVKTNYSDSE